MPYMEVRLEAEVLPTAARVQLAAAVAMAAELQLAEEVPDN